MKKEGVGGCLSNAVRSANPGRHTSAVGGLYAAGPGPVEVPFWGGGRPEITAAGALALVSVTLAT